MSLGKESRGLKLKDWVAIVTGGCNGIGRGCVDVLVENGGKVAVLDVDDTAGSQMTTDGPGEIYFIMCDATKENDIKKAVEATIARYGRVDCLVNNIGRHPGQIAVDDMSVEDFRQLVDFNLTSHFTALKYALPHIRKVKGSVVNIASVSGTYGTEHCPAYCATKAAISGMTKAMAIDEAKYGVRVNSIAPATIRTPMVESLTEKFPPGYVESLANYTVMRRLGEPREIGQACLFLAVDATYTTGSELLCTGGSDIGYGLKPE